MLLCNSLRQMQRPVFMPITSDFVGKVAGSLVENPNKAYRTSINTGSGANTLLQPSAFTIEDVGYNSGYSNILSIGNGSAYATNQGLGAISQQLFSFNIIRMIEDKYGLIPVDRNGTAAEVLARQVQWCKDNGKVLTIKWTGYGSCPIGNKAGLAVWNGSAWFGGTYNWLVNTVSSPSLLNSDIAINNLYLQPDGFIHFLAYTDAARTTDSTLLVLTGHGLISDDLIENTTRNVIKSVKKGTNDTLITSATTNQTSGDTIRKYHVKSINKIAETGTTSSKVTITGHGLVTGDAICVQSRGYSRITVVDASNFTLDTPIAGTTVGDNLSFYSYTGTQTAESTVISSTIFTDYINLKIDFKN